MLGKAASLQPKPEREIARKDSKKSTEHKHRGDFGHCNVPPKIETAISAATGLLPNKNTSLLPQEGLLQKPAPRMQLHRKASAFLPWLLRKQSGQHPRCRHSPSKLLEICLNYFKGANTAANLLHLTDVPS